MKQITLDFAPEPSYRASDFVVSACNQHARAQIDAWPNWPSHGLVLVGEKASGKTHLAHIWAEKSAAMCVGIEDDIANLPASPVYVDNADAWTGEAAETKLFHLLNLAKEQKQSILLTASTPPAAWQLSLKDLQSRLNALPQVELHAPDEVLLTAVLTKHFFDRQVLVDGGVIQYIVARQERSFQETKRIAAALDALALEQKRPITLPLVRQVLMVDGG